MVRYSEKKRKKKEGRRYFIWILRFLSLNYFDMLLPRFFLFFPFLPTESTEVSRWSFFKEARLSKWSRHLSFYYFLHEYSLTHLFSYESRRNITYKHAPRWTACNAFARVTRLRRHVCTWQGIMLIDWSLWQRETDWNRYEAAGTALISTLITKIHPCDRSAVLAQSALGYICS